MSMQNLAIVFGPTLLGQSPPMGNGAASQVLPDTHHQNLVRFRVDPYPVVPFSDYSGHRLLKRF